MNKYPKVELLIISVLFYFAMKADAGWSLVLLPTLILLTLSRIQYYLVDIPDEIFEIVWRFILRRRTIVDSLGSIESLMWTTPSSELGNQLLTYRNAVLAEILSGRASTIDLINLQTGGLPLGKSKLEAMLIEDSNFKSEHERIFNLEWILKSNLVTNKTERRYFVRNLVRLLKRLVFFGIGLFLLFGFYITKDLSGEYLLATMVTLGGSLFSLSSLYSELGEHISEGYSSIFYHWLSGGYCRSQRTILSPEEIAQLKVLQEQDQYWENSIHRKLQHSERKLKEDIQIAAKNNRFRELCKTGHIYSPYSYFGYVAPEIQKLSDEDKDTIRPLIEAIKWSAIDKYFKIRDQSVSGVYPVIDLLRIQDAGIRFRITRWVETPLGYDSHVEHTINF